MAPVQVASHAQFPSTATGYSNQRKIDRCQNGVLWSIINYNTGYIAGNMQYSLDNGVTWVAATNPPNGSGQFTDSYVRSCSIFIDLDDYCHLVFKDGSDGYIYYRRGTPNAERTAWTWSAAALVYNTSTSRDYPDVVAHREGTGWVAHVVASQHASGSSAFVSYDRIVISSSGDISATFATVDISASTGNTVPKYPSIDFNHTGDGKTVAGGTPHLYVAWSAGATGAGKGIRFKKATYSAGPTWTWGTERELNDGLYIPNASYWLNCMFDGTRVIVGGFLLGSDTVPYLWVMERDVADTATTNAFFTGQTDLNLRMAYGSLTYDTQGNIYAFGANQDEAAGSRDLVYRKWTRSGASLGGEVVIDSAVGDPYVTVKRGFSNNRVEFIYTDGTASPYNVNYDSILLPTGGPRMMV